MNSEFEICTLDPNGYDEYYAEADTIEALAPYILQCTRNEQPYRIYKTTRELVVEAQQ